MDDSSEHGPADALDDVVRGARPDARASRAGSDGPDRPDGPRLPLDAAEEDPDAGVTAQGPGYSAGGAGEGHVGPPSSDHP